MLRNKALLIIILVNFLFIQAPFSQHLHPGFNKKEYIEMLKVSAKFGDSNYIRAFPEPEKFHFVYRSPEVGLGNMWDLWTSTDSIAVISIRGTTSASVSWLANFYAAMVPAQGQLQLSATDTFSYKLASNPRATVHVGWLISMAYLVKDLMPRIDSCYNNGIKDFIIMGHSQGGAIAFLLTAYLRELQFSNTLHQHIQFKTYCSAGPKPGNLYFAQEYEAHTQQGWAYNVVNSADWVPETPVSIQTVNDFNAVNPFITAKDQIKKLKFPTNLLMRYVYNRLDKPTRKAQRNYQKYLGKMTSTQIKKALPDFQPPAYAESNDYVRTGNTIVLLADEEYYKLYPNDKDKIFTHHFHPPYLYLANKLPD
ncbi:MAG: lipase family protein [Agriterribacter sp.]